MKGLQFRLVSIAINSRKSRQMRRGSLTKCRTRRRFTCGDEAAKRREGGDKHEKRFVAIRAGSRINSLSTVGNSSGWLSGRVAEQPSNAKSPETPPPLGEVPQSSKKFGFMRGAAGEVPIAAPPAAAKTVDTAGNGFTLSASAPTQEKIGGCPFPSKNPSLLPGSDGEHLLQTRYGSRDRAQAFYGRQVLNFLSPRMREFVAQQEYLFVATADRHGECDCTSKFGKPGFIDVLGDKHVLYPEFRGNGVFARISATWPSY